MANKRNKIVMTSEEIASFIEQQICLQVATINKDGSPNPTTLFFAIVEGSIVFGTFTNPQKIVNLKHGPRTRVGQTGGNSTGFRKISA